MGPRRLAQRPALAAAGRCDAHARASHDPMADGWRPRCWRDAKRPREEPQDACDGATAEPPPHKALQGQPDHVHRGPGDRSVPWGRALTQGGLELVPTRLGRVAGGGDAVSLGADGRVLSALVALAGTARRGVVLPLRATGGACGARAHHAGSAPPPGRRPGGWGGMAMQMSAEARAMGGVLHPASEREA